MITSFANKETEKLFATGKSKKFPPEIIIRSIMRLTQLDSAREVTDLLIPPQTVLKHSLAIGRDSGVSGLTTNGEYAFGLKTAKQKMLK
jgi:plasmid maintenance system killer protein